MVYAKSFQNSCTPAALNKIKSLCLTKDIHRLQLNLTKRKHLIIKEMKKILSALFLLAIVNCYGQVNSDSLWNVIRSPGYSDSLKLEAYEVITKDLLYKNEDSCRAVCRDGLEFSKNIGNHRFTWSFYNRIGRAYKNEGDIEKTIEYFHKSLAVAEQARDTFTIAQTMNNIGIIYDDELGDSKKALDYYLKSIKFKKQLKGTEDDYFSLAMTQLYAGNIYLNTEQWDNASKIFNEAKNLAEQITNNHKKYIVYSNLGTYSSYYGSRKNNQKMVFEAIKYYLLAEDVIKSSGNKVNYGKTLANIGDAYFFVDQIDLAESNMDKAVEVAKEVNSYDLWEMIYEIYQNFNVNQKNFELAYYYKDSLMQISDSINSIEKQTAIAEIETRYQTEKLKKEVIQKEEENKRERFMRNIFTISTAIFLVLILIIAYLFSRLRKNNLKLTNNKEELEALNKNLQISKSETEKALEFKSLFLANMSHEIRTPLNIIIGFNSILKKKISDSKLKKYLESIEMSSYNLLRLLNDILDMSKIEAGKILLSPTSINLKLLITNITELFMLKAGEKGLDLDFEIDAKMPSEIIIDEIRLRQILVNLIGNAIKFTAKGYVKIFVDAPILNKYQSEFATKINVRIQVKDSGIGISEKDLTKIFESFRQVNVKEQKEMGGTGLGLAISKRLTEMMNGEISVESQKGIGSVFTLLFRDVPISFASETKTNNRVDLHDELEYEFTGGTILVADDEEMNRSLIKVCFENTAVTILEASNGHETIDLARKHQPDIIMMDIKMPGLDGMEATRIIKHDEQLKNIKIIAFSASNIFDRLEKDEIALFYGLISKPVLLDEMYEIVSEILPNRIKDKKAIELKDDNLNINLFIDENIRENIKDAEYKLEELNQKWRKINNTNSINKILEFANEIEEFAVSKNLPKLKDYAMHIGEAGKNFDINRIKVLLKLFPELFEKGYN